MPDTAVIVDKILSAASFAAVIPVAIDQVDLADWLFSLSDGEYQRCAPPDHKAAAASTTDDGRPLAIHVEMIGTGLHVHHYRAELAGAHHCRLISESDVFNANGWTTVHVVWDLRVTPRDDQSCECVSAVTIRPTLPFMIFLSTHDLAFKSVAAARQAMATDHQRRETPLFAASIARRAAARRAELDHRR